jgi:hypothetical protein
LCHATAFPGSKHWWTISDLTNVFYVNCTGHAANRFLDAAEPAGVVDRADQCRYEPLRDPTQARFVRGHYLRVDVGRSFADYVGRFSYNYTPTADVYHNARGEAADVYCYPRSDCWILGGSRQVQEGPLDPSGRWHGEDTPTDEQEYFPTYNGAPLGIPSPIFAVNAQILERLTQGRLNLSHVRATTPRAFVAGVGLRFQRSSPSNDVRVSCSRVDYGSEKIVFHNYGHGGAGFTLSWGCAFDILQLLNQITSTDPSETLSAPGHARETQTIQTMLSELTFRLLTTRA